MIYIFRSYLMGNYILTPPTDTLTPPFGYLDTTLRLPWHSLTRYDKTPPLAPIRASNTAYRVRTSKKKNFAARKRSFYFNFFKLFNLMKRRRLTTSSHLASSVLVYLLSLFRHCLSSFSTSSSSNWWLLSFSASFSVSFSVSLPVSFPARGWISSMNSKHCLRVHHLIWHSRLHLHAFKLRRLSQCWIVERLFFCSNFLHLHISMMILHFRISMMILRVLILHRRRRRSSSVFRIWRSFARSHHVWFLNTKKRINDSVLQRHISFEFRENLKSVKNTHELND